MTGPDLGSEYGRLLAQRDRLIADGVDPAELAVPLPLDPDPLRPPDPLVQLREQRRRSRWSCSVALVAIVAALVVAWALIILVASAFVSAVVAAPRSGSQPVEVGKPRQQVTVTAGSLSGAPLFNQARTADRGALAVERRILTSGVAAAEPVQEGTRSAADQPGRPPAAAVPALATLSYTGTLGYATPSHGSRYLAIRWPRGTIATLCGPADCVTRTSTDFGPVRSLWEAGRLADLSAVDWQRVCGVDLRYGLCSGTLVIVSRPRALPDTSTEKGP